MPATFAKVALLGLAYFMLFMGIGKGLLTKMEIKGPKEYQTARLFAILGLLTLMIVLLFKVVLFAPQNEESFRRPAHLDQLPSLKIISTSDEKLQKQ